MEVMIAFTRELLTNIAEFFMMEPIIYLFAICCLIGIVKVFRALVP